MGRILFYGASNVYGFDPRLASDLFSDLLSEGRYPNENIWTTILANALAGSWEVLADGMNGRRIPNLKYDRETLNRLFERHKPLDVFAFMLGTNDILASLDVDVEAVLRRMEAFVGYLMEQQGRLGFSILMIAPVWVGDDLITDADFVRFREKCRNLNHGYKAIADKYSIGFADAQEFGVELCFDHVHFTEKGHRTFAEKMRTFLLDKYDSRRT